MFEPTIAPLETRAADAKAVAAWLLSQWGRLPIHEYLEAIDQSNVWPHPLPRTLVASIDGHPVGTVSILLGDLETRPEINPWLGCLYVDPRYRRQGIGTGLLLAAERLAFGALGIRKLFLFTEDQEGLYARHGWISVEQDNYRGKAIAIMQKQSK